VSVILRHFLCWQGAVRRTPRVLPQQCYRIASGRNSCSIATNRNAASAKKGQNLAANGG